MTSRNAAVYGTCGAVLVACLAAANMPPQDPAAAMTHAVRDARVHPDIVAADVQSQAARLHQRMAQAPTPSAAVRNPFAFGSARRARTNPAGVEGMVHATVADAPEPAAPAPPPLVLMGIAEESTPAGPRRTAIVGSGEDVLFAREGELILGRYKVGRVGADAVELEDQTTKAYRRIALR